jgi:hypothetical protein
MKCFNCGASLEKGVYRSAAGYYVGTWCNRCGPHSRESQYFTTREEAAFELVWRQEAWVHA